MSGVGMMLNGLITAIFCPTSCPVPVSCLAMMWMCSNGTPMRKMRSFRCTQGSAGNWFVDRPQNHLEEFSVVASSRQCVRFFSGATLLLCLQ